MRILIVDRCEPLRRVLTEFLDTKPGVVVVAEARSGDEALGQVVRVRPDLVLMGLKTPGMDGYEATRAIKALLPKTRVVILSDHSGEAYRLAAATVQADGYIEKQSLKAPLLDVLSAMGSSLEAA